MKKNFPNIRLRRLRNNSPIRNLVRENILSPHDLIQPLFVIEGNNKTEKIKSMPNIHRLSIDLAIKASKESLINLVFIDNKKDIPMFKEIKNSIFIKSKQDLNNKPFLDSGYFNVSSETGYGITDILSVLKNKITSGLPQEPSFISRERHINCLEAVIMHLENSQIPKNIDLFAEDLRLSIKEFSNLFGSVEIDDILDIIFSDFCIGK